MQPCLQNRCLPLTRFVTLGENVISFVKVFLQVCRTTETLRPLHDSGTRSCVYRIYAKILSFTFFIGSSFYCIFIFSFRWFTVSRVARTDVWDEYKLILSYKPWKMPHKHPLTPILFHYFCTK